MHESLWEQATESDWPEEERRQWYRERPRDEEYAGAPEKRAHQEGEADAAAAPPGGRAHALGHRLRGQVPPAAPGRGALPAAREPRLRRRAHRAAEARPGGGVGPGPGGDHALPQVHQRRRRRALPQLGPCGQLGERAAGPRFQLLQPPTAAHHGF